MTSIVSKSVIPVFELLELQAQALRKVADQIQTVHLENALNLLVNCKGKVVLSGVGKSGIIAQIGRAHV